MENSDNTDFGLFHFDIDKKKPKENIESKREQRKKGFTGNQDPDDAKRKREDKNTTLRKDHK